MLLGIGPSGGQLPADVGGFLDRAQRLLPPSQVGQPVGQVVKRRGQGGAECVLASVMVLQQIRPVGVAPVEQLPNRQPELAFFGQAAGKCVSQ